MGRATDKLNKKYLWVRLNKPTNHAPVHLPNNYAAFGRRVNDASASVTFCGILTILIAVRISRKCMFCVLSLRLKGVGLI
jgi:hypothetical protein